MNVLSPFIPYDTIFLVLIMRCVGLSNHVTSKILRLPLQQFNLIINTQASYGYRVYLAHYRIIDMLYTLANRVGERRKEFHDIVISYLIYGNNSVFTFLNAIIPYIRQLEKQEHTQFSSGQPLFRDIHKFGCLWSGMLPPIYLHERYTQGV